ISERFQKLTTLSVRVVNVGGKKDRRVSAPQQVLGALQRQPLSVLDVYLDEIRSGNRPAPEQVVEADRLHCHVALRRKMSHSAARLLDKRGRAGAIRHGPIDHGHIGDSIEAQMLFQKMNVFRQWLESVYLPARPDQDSRQERVKSHMRA